MRFTKVQGTGNDFIIVQAASWDEAQSFQPAAGFLCDRHFGVGADGLIVIGTDDEADIFMRIFNSDGSEAEMCGNGIRCVAKYAYEHGLVKKQTLAVRTLAGLRYPQLILADDRIEAVRVDMGVPVLDRPAIPVSGEGANVGIKLETEGGEFIATAVSMGNPHCVIFVDDVRQFPVGHWGPLVEKHALFPARTNVEFVQMLGPQEMIMRVWERGAGITLACGTGACASLVAACLNNKSARGAVVHLPGGDLSVEWDQDDHHVYMTGPAVEVFSGTIVCPVC